jgi:hypothetical protein
MNIKVIVFVIVLIFMQGFAIHTGYEIGKDTGKLEQWTDNKMDIDFYRNKCLVQNESNA